MKMIRSIRLKFMLVFIGILLITSLSSLAAVSGFTRSTILSDTENRLRQTASVIVLLSERTDLSLEEIFEITEYSDHSIKTSADLSAFRIKDADSADFQPVFIESYGEQRSPAYLFFARGSYILLTAKDSQGGFTSFQNRLFFSVMLCALIGGVLMLIAITQITKPIKRLTDATEEIAKGNFNISIEYDSADEIGTLTQSFNTMARELNGMDYLRNDFISSVSHEFKTPLASVRGFAKLLKNPELSKSELEEYTDIIIGESERLSNMASNILRLSRLENQPILGTYTRFSLDEQIRNALLLLEQDWSKKNLEPELDLEAFYYEGPEELLQQVWINLIDNAIKYSFPGGKFYISLKKEQDSIKVKIADTGVGIPDAAKDHVFEKFYQADADRSQEGNGLGLAIVKKILDLCGGTITLKSQIGSGTAFYITLPAEISEIYPPKNT